MKPQPPVHYDDPGDLHELDEQTPEDDLWFLPGPLDDASEESAPDPKPDEAALLDAWRAAEASHAARLASVAGRLGGLDERLRRGPEGWGSGQNLVVDVVG